MRAMKRISVTAIILLLAVFHLQAMGMPGKELNENSIAPVPILGGRGQEVSLAGGSWQGVPKAEAWPGVAADRIGQATVSAGEGTWTKLAVSGGKTAAVIETTGFEVKPWHIYQVEIPLRGPCSTIAGVLFRLTGGEHPVEISAWPSLFESASGLNPAGFVVRGYAAVPSGAGTKAVIRIRVYGKSGLLAETGQPRITDLGMSTLIQPETWWTLPFDDWTSDGQPEECGLVLYAKPGQFVPTTEDVHSGQTAAMNKNGYVWLWGSRVPCRFGTFVRIRVWARGKGDITVSAQPFFSYTRGLPCMETRFTVDGGWKCYEIIIGQNRVEADVLIPSIFIDGSVTIDDWTVEMLTAPL